MVTVIENPCAVFINDAQMKVLAMFYPKDHLSHWTTNSNYPAEKDYQNTVWYVQDHCSVE
jgi:hypothetical protein